MSSSAQPRWCTPRDHSRPTFGPAVDALARVFGGPLMPAQRAIADTMGEVLSDGRMAYPVCVLLIPRRGGKTHLMFPTMVQRAACAPDARVWYTAQTQSDAEETFREDWVPMVDRSPLAGAMRRRLSNGSKRFTLPAGGQVGVFAPTEKALHGKYADAAVVDEAWAFDVTRGRQLEAAIRPTMLTRPSRQLVIISAGGTEDSTWLLDWRDAGRRSVEEGVRSGIFYCEYSPADDDDLDDPDVWARTHPAVGETFPMSVLQDDHRTMDRSLFYRSYLNVFTTSAMSRLIPADDYAACEAAGALLDLPARPVIGYDVDHDRATGAITAVGMHPDGTPHAELRWVGSPDLMADELQALHRSGRYRIVADGYGPAATVTAELQRRRVPVDLLTTGEACTASAELLDAVRARRLLVTPEPRMAGAARDASRRDVGDAWVFTRKRSAGSVAPITAAAWALTRALKMPATRLPVMVVTA